ncbi:MAG: siphovirus Gp157 family protein [Cetobacterium sp.]
MSVSMYVITQEMERLEELYEASINEETGELDNADTLEQLELEINSLLVNKSEGIIKYMRMEELAEKALKEEIDRLTALRKRKQKKIEGFKNYIEFNMTKIGVKKIETNVGNLGLRKSVKTIVNEDIIAFDEKYAKVEEVVKYDKTIIKKLLSDGVKIDGAFLEDSYSVSIK